LTTNDQGVRLCTLASGSSGNCVYINCRGTELLVDAGISLRAIEHGLQALGTSAANLSAVLITHEHIDHVRGLLPLVRKYNIPFYIDRLCACALPEDSHANAYEPPEPLFIEVGRGFGVGAAQATPFRTPHDSAANVGYIIECGGARVGVATDVGSITGQVANALLGCGTVVLESNYDRDMLLTGRYPPYLKARIMSGAGHLSNDDASVFLCRLVSSGTRQAVLYHLSHENNHPILALETAQYTLGRQGIRSRIAFSAYGPPAQCVGQESLFAQEADITLYVAPRSALGDLLVCE